MLTLNDTPRRRLNIINKLVSTAIIASTAMVFYIAYLLLWPSTPFVVKGTSVLTPKVSAEGGTVQYVLDYCKYTTKVSTVSRQLVGAGSNISGYGFPQVEGVAKSGCHRSTILLPLPVGVKPGFYYIHGDLDYPANAIRNVHVYYDTEPFEVTK